MAGTFSQDSLPGSVTERAAEGQARIRVHDFQPMAEPNLRKMTKAMCGRVSALR
jgi:hypothetical protein